MDFEVSPELIGIYLEDARAHLNVLDNALLRLEREGVQDEVVASVLGPLHTLKGNSGMMGFVSVKEYVHRLEDVFARLRAGSLVPSQAVFDRMLAGATALRDAIERAGHAGKEQRDLGAECDALAAFCTGPAPARVPLPTMTEAPPVPAPPVVKAPVVASPATTTRDATPRPAAPA